MEPYRRVDEERLDRDVEYRVAFVQEFLGFDDETRREIHALCPLILPRLPALVKAVYDKMLEFDATRRHLAVRQTGYPGEIPQSLDAVTAEHDLLAFRRRAMTEYFSELLLSSLDESTADWMDTIGRMHTTKAGNASIHVPLIQMNAMMGYIADLLFREVGALDIAPEAKLRGVRALSKLLWLQNDLLSRHYA